MLDRNAMEPRTGSALPTRHFNQIGRLSLRIYWSHPSTGADVPALGKQRRRASLVNQDIADSLTPRDLVTCGQKWLAHLTPFFSAREREQAGRQHRLFFSQVEFCDNLIFRRRTALDMLGERLLDANRTIGRPDKITVIFGRKITKHYRGKLQTEIEDMNLPNPCLIPWSDDQLTEILRQGARTLLAQAVEAEVADFLVKHADLKTENGREASGAPLNDMTATFWPLPVRLDG
jgi:hypothetical protein